MSTLQAVNLKNAASASNNIVLDASGNATFAGTAAMASSFLRNRIINGDMRIDQRNAGASVNVTSGSAVFGPDRFQVFSIGSTQVIQRVAGTGGFQNALQITGAAGNTTTTVFQRIEAANSFDLAGNTVTVSARITVPSAITLTWFLFRANATDNFSGVTQEATGTVSLSSGVNTVSFSAALSASATTGLQLDLRFGAFTSGSLQITGVQLEVGTAATPFERRQYGQELAWCQRSYMLSTNGYGWGYAAGAGNYRATSVSFPVTMRSSPTIALSSISYGFASSLTTESINPNGFGGYVTIGGAANFTVSFTYAASIEL